MPTPSRSWSFPHGFHAIRFGAGGSSRERGQRDCVYRNLVTLFHDKPFRWWRQFAMEVDCCLQPVLAVHEALATPLAVQRRLVTATPPSLDPFTSPNTGAGGY